jgi:hypothetical protein
VSVYYANVGQFLVRPNNAQIVVVQYCKPVVYNIFDVIIHVNRLDVTILFDIPTV